MRVIIVSVSTLNVHRKQKKSTLTYYNQCKQGHK